MSEEFNPSVEYEQKGYLNCDFRLFHIDESKAIDTPWHYHDFDKIVFFLRGDVQYAVEGREYELRPYDIVIVPHHSIHKVTASAKEGYERYVLYVKPETLVRLGKTQEVTVHEGKKLSGKTKDHDLDLCFNMTSKTKTNLVHFDAGITSELMDKFRTLEDVIRSEEDLYCAGLRIHVSLIQLLIGLNEACFKHPDAFMEKARYNRKVIDIIDYIMEHLGDDLSIDKISDEFYISKYHMMRIFKAETGYSVHQYIMEKRILRARDLIIAGEPAMSASIESGFHDYSSFCKAFRKATGKLPSDYVANI
ncbi:AraC-type DNA-binding protein [Butyrivibrio fibrisolvens DSM 3071]|uniref:AraC-type DNA-binding protein n=1 Tax=Butyrivibrio fibrisolvens DSM 3071 TaxID=1121131 RepID=A0A1M5TB64_BUTFI|nr:AraC family transcriptional regulator [Butyrivibrio fibrisolvens]SHH47926.1 AraC-type DNA-binding protein [Butyrivibrio fibrisolvens DSM 3071]